jgi:hypothetical protein
MRAKLLCMSAVLALLLPASVRVLAHHSFAAEYELKTAAWSGTVTKLEFANPHVHFYVDLKDDAGEVVNWGFELPNPEQLIRRGLTRSFLKVGDSVTVVGYPAKDALHLAMTKTVALSDGRMVFTWDYKDFGGAKSSDDGLPERQPL